MTPPKPAKILETALYVGDLDRAEAFYSEILGLERLQRVGTRHVFFRVGAGVLLLFNPKETEIANPDARLPVPPHGARGPGHICFAAEAAEIEAWVEHFTARGIAIEADFNWPYGARSIYIRDPDGNSVEFAEPWLWEG
ncbi:fosfomycin resistance protein FosB [Pseudoruegeria aquimaris]|uniref:Fosfomycin resistance protein FosB n=1 Tax=Pseudoruegeria aquimaris TaxID=393663 RepID=A0A1Y5R8E8_9RHOB|nr:VOC family protein [Pseudoruegeria aquimaris]SLN10863.1 fosfomycin resistance protein FosB [Pseudoruegeria aquimaris]